MQGSNQWIKVTDCNGGSRQSIFLLSGGFCCASQERYSRLFELNILLYSMAACFSLYVIAITLWWSPKCHPWSFSNPLTHYLLKNAALEHVIMIFYAESQQKTTNISSHLWLTILHLLSTRMWQIHDNIKQK